MYRLFLTFTLLHKKFLDFNFFLPQFILLKALSFDTSQYIGTRYKRFSNGWLGGGRDGFLKLFTYISKLPLRPNKSQEHLLSYVGVFPRCL